MEDSAVQQAPHLLSWTGHHKLWQDFVQANSCTETSRNLRAQDSLASEYHSITWSGLLQVKQKPDKRRSVDCFGLCLPTLNFKFQFEDLQIGTWNFWIQINLCGSWAVRLLRIAPCTEAGSATWHPSLSIRWLEQQSAHRDRCWSRHLRDRDYEIHKLEGFSFLIFPSQCARAQHVFLDGYKC